MPLYYQCPTCGSTFTESGFINQCSNCTETICLHCQGHHQIQFHLQQPRVDNHIRCNQCSAEGFRTDMMECAHDRQLLCNEHCFNLHIQEKHGIKGGTLRPGTFHAGTRLDITQKKKLPALPTRREENPNELPQTELAVCEDCENPATHRCEDCRHTVCGDHWVGTDDYCTLRMCQSCYEDHSCPNRVECIDCDEPMSREDRYYCDVCESNFCEECYNEHDCPDAKICFNCDSRFHRNEAVSCSVCTTIACSRECVSNHTCSVVTPEETARVERQRQDRAAIDRARAEAGQAPHPWEGRHPMTYASRESPTTAVDLTRAYQEIVDENETPTQTNTVPNQEEL